MDSPKAGSERSEGFEVLEPQSGGSTSEAPPLTPEQAPAPVAPAPSPVLGGAASLAADPAKLTPAGQGATGPCTQPVAAPPVMVLVNRSELEVQSKAQAVATLLLAACLILNHTSLLRAGAGAAVVCALAGLQPQRTLRCLSAAAGQGRKAVALFVELSPGCVATVTAGLRRARAAITALGTNARAACCSNLIVPFLGGMVVGAVLTMAVRALWSRTLPLAVTFCTDALFGREFWSAASENVHGPVWCVCAWSFLLLACPMAVWLPGRQMVPPRFEGE